MAQGRPGEVTPVYREDRQRWEARVTIRLDADGKPVRRMFTGRTRKEVADRVKAAIRAKDDGIVPASRTMTVGKWLDIWLDDLVPGTVAAGTLENYRTLARIYIRPEVGRVALVDLQPRDVTRMVRKVAAAGKSANTQRLVRATLVRALKRAEREGLVPRNVAALSDGVRIGTPEGRSLTVEQAVQLLDAVSGNRAEAAFVLAVLGDRMTREQVVELLDATTGDRLAAAYTVALTLGLRRGELLGLTWADLDLDADSPTALVRRQLKREGGEGLVLGEQKTRQSRRRLHLSPRTLSALAVHRMLLDAEAKVVGNAWPTAPLGADLIFRTPLGTPVDPDNFTSNVRRTTAGLFGESWSPHTLRHSAASLLLADGVGLKIISEVMGHSSTRITADVYAHLMDEAGSVAAESMGRMLG